ncbi:hypothetical protein Syun_004179 [Stephania yunnanensis]|uniref:Uncharacterized protein n=1 Tax=Stephania yunnanensis TaxID=152371 RepID=A0AAP0L429_9MAGN
MTSSHSIWSNEMCFIRGAVYIPHSRHFRYGDAASDDRVCLALPRLCDPDPVEPAFGGLRLLGNLSLLFPLTLILVILLDFTYLGSSISCLTECRATDESYDKSGGNDVSSAAATSWWCISDRSLLDEECDLTKFDDAIEESGVGCANRGVSGHFEDELRISSMEWSIWQVSYGYCYLRYESVRAGRQRSRPKHESHGLGRGGRCLVLDPVARVRAGRLGSRPKPESAGLLPRFNDLLVRTPYWLGGPLGLRPDGAQFVGNWGRHTGNTSSD